MTMQYSAWIDSDLGFESLKLDNESPLYFVYCWGRHSNEALVVANCLHVCLIIHSTGRNWCSKESTMSTTGSETRPWSGGKKAFESEKNKVLGSATNRIIYLESSFGSHESWWVMR